MSGETLVKCLQRVLVDSPYRSGERLVHERAAGPSKGKVKCRYPAVRGLVILRAALTGCDDWEEAALSDGGGSGAGIPKTRFGIPSKTAIDGAD